MQGLIILSLISDQRNLLELNSDSDLDTESTKESSAVAPSHAEELKVDLVSSQTSVLSNTEITLFVLFYLIASSS